MKKDQSFGIIPTKVVPGGYVLLMIQHVAGHWGFPKGHANKDESPVAAATRELTEETALTDVTVDEKAVFTETYRFARHGKTVRKTVTYYLALVADDTVQVQAEEIQGFRWVTPTQGAEQMTFPEGKKLVEEVRRYLASRHAGVAST